MNEADYLHLSPSEPSRFGESASSNVRIDPLANAALAETIRNARQNLKAGPATAKPSQNAEAAASSNRFFKGSLLTQVAAAVLFVGAGWAASHLGSLETRNALRSMQAETAQSQAALAKLTGELAVLKNTMAAARDVEQTSSTTISDQAKLSEKIERLAAAIQEPVKKLSTLEDRLNRIEGKIMAGLNNPDSIKPSAEPARESAPVAQPVKSEPVEGWVLREVYNGSALVESRRRGLYEVMPGNVIPGVGRVEAIERRGARWVVVTDRGFIGTYR
jgi:hypothetical protein